MKKRIMIYLISIVAMVLFFTGCNEVQKGLSSSIQPSNTVASTPTQSENTRTQGITVTQVDIDVLKKRPRKPFKKRRVWRFLTRIQKNGEYTVL